MAKQTKVNTGIRSLLSTPTAQAKPPTPPAQAKAKQTETKRGRKSTDRVVTIAATVKTSVKDELTRAAETEGVSLNALLGFLVADAFDRYKSGKLKPKHQTVTVTKLSK